jgi:hypothetical protein
MLEFFVDALKDLEDLRGSARLHPTVAEILERAIASLRSLIATAQSGAVVGRGDIQSVVRDLREIADATNLPHAQWALLDGAVQSLHAAVYQASA